MGVFEKYNRCYREGLEIGFCEKGKPCRGEEPRPRVVKKECLQCIYYHERKEAAHNARIFR